MSDDSLDRAANKASLRNHPGFFGVTSQGVIAIHADWPMYPEEHGGELALLWLTAFPAGTVFKRIDDIDQCVLLLAEPSTKPDPFDERNYHVAIWYEDLLELGTKAFVTGVSVATRRSWEIARFANRPVPGPWYAKLDDGRLVKIPDPDFEEYDDEDESWITVARDGITVSPLGREEVSRLLVAPKEDFQSLGERVPNLLELSYYDTAVREACVAIEDQIKTWLGSTKWGDALLAQFTARLNRDGRLLNTEIRVLRAEVRLAFKFIRNEFAHNLLRLDETQCKAKLFRLARLKSTLDSVTRG